MQDLRPNEKRAKNVILLIQFVLVAKVTMLASLAFQYKLVLDAESGIEITSSSAEANDLRQRIIAILFMIIYIISVVNFIKWFRRAYFNLHTKINGLQEDEASAAYSWFIPIVCLYKPFKIMKEMYLETDLLLSKKSERYTKKISTEWLGWWWGLWIVSNLMGQIVFRTSMRADTIDKIKDNTEISMIYEFIGIPLCLLALKVIKDYAKVEPLLFDLKDNDTQQEAPQEIISA